MAERDMDALELVLALNIILYQLISCLDEDTRDRLRKSLELWSLMADTNLKQFEHQFSADSADRIKRYVEELRLMVL